MFEDIQKKVQQKLTEKLNVVHKEIKVNQVWEQKLQSNLKSFDEVRVTIFLTLLVF